MKGFLDDDRDLEVDLLTDGKPVEFVPQHRSDMLRTDCSLLTTMFV